MKWQLILGLFFKPSWKGRPQGTWFDPRSLLPVFVWVCSGFFGFFPASKNTLVGGLATLYYPFVSRVGCIPALHQMFPGSAVTLANMKHLLKMNESVMVNLY